MAISPPDWNIKVGNATSEFTKGNPSGINQQQQTVNGVLSDIEFTMEGFNDLGSSKLATISYERSDISEQAPIRRHALVQIALNNLVIFAGIVRSQSITHSKVTLSCMSQIDLLNLAPTYGVKRDHSGGVSGRYFQTALSIFNEKGKPDRSFVFPKSSKLGPSGSAKFGALESFIPADSKNKDKKLKWFREDVLKYLLNDILFLNLDGVFQQNIITKDIAEAIDSIRPKS